MIRSNVKNSLKYEEATMELSQIFGPTGRIYDMN